MTGDELARLFSEFLEFRVDRPFIELTSPPRRTDSGWLVGVRRAESPDSYSTCSISISDGHSDARVRSYVAAVGRYLRARLRFPLHVGHSSLIDSPVGDNAFDRVLNDARANLILTRESRNARLVATIDPERRGHVPVLANPDLEAAIAGRPDDIDAHAVYGDWLAQRGDPRGELIAVQIARSTRPDDAALAQREAELLETYAYEWLGSFAWSFPGELRVTWRYGFIERIVFTRPSDEDLASRNSHLDALRALVTLPSLACLREVELGGEDNWPGEQFWAVLAEVGLPPSVRRLAITATKRFMARPVDLSRTYPVLARLDALEIGFHELDFGTTFPLPNLRSLALYRISRVNVAALRSSRWPRLERLFLRLSHQYEGDQLELALADLAWLLEAGSLPALRQLGLGGTLTAELVTALAASPLVRQLSTLDLSQAWSTLELRRALETAMPALEHLDVHPPARQP